MFRGDLFVIIAKIFFLREFLRSVCACIQLFLEQLLFIIIIIIIIIDMIIENVKNGMLYNDSAP